MSSTGGENDSSSIHDSDLEFLTSSPSGSSLDYNDSMKNLNEGSGINCSGNISKEDADDGIRPQLNMVFWVIINKISG
ncbi:hypothetical protein ACFX13_035374 [Malus domestica]